MSFQVKRKAEEEKLAEVMAGEIILMPVACLTYCYKYACLPPLIFYIKSTVHYRCNEGEIQSIMLPLCVVMELLQTFSEVMHPFKILKFHEICNTKIP